MRRATLVAKSIALAALAVAGCASTAPAPTGEAPLAELQGLMVGYFNSAKQAAADKDYFNIELRVVPVWTERADGPWLYIEQADAKTPEKPYRQRLYRLVRLGERYESRVYELRGDPLRVAGAWKQAKPLAGLTPEDLVERAGCTVIMSRTGPARYQGATEGKECISTLRGAAYATAEVDITASTLKSWDRGMAADGRQVWGAMKGGYAFEKVRDRP
jgi:hypothetical protein